MYARNGWESGNSSCVGHTNVVLVRHGPLDLVEATHTCAACAARAARVVHSPVPRAITPPQLAHTPNTMHHTPHHTHTAHTTRHTPHTTHHTAHSTDTTHTTHNTHNKHNTHNTHTTLTPRCSCYKSTHSGSVWSCYTDRHPPSCAWTKLMSLLNARAFWKCWSCYTDRHAASCARTKMLCLLYEHVLNAVC